MAEQENSPKQTTIEVLICTCGQGIGRVKDVLLPPQEDVEYLVSWQTECPDLVPEILCRRKDVRVITLPGRGLSRNRNHALRHAHGDILLIADDDVRYTPGSFLLLRQAFLRHPSADILTFRAADYEGKLLHAYSETSYCYARRPRGSFVSSYEIACRCSPRLPLFDERFGLGNDMIGCGEEEVFVHTAWRNGLEVVYEPLTLVRTEPASTGTRFFTSPSVQRAKGAVLCVMHGHWSAWLRCLKYALTLPRHTSRFQIFREMNRGINYVLRHGGRYPKDMQTDKGKA